MNALGQVAAELRDAEGRAEEDGLGHMRESLRAVVEALDMEIRSVMSQRDRLELDLSWVRD